MSTTSTRKRFFVTVPLAVLFLAGCVLSGCSAPPADSPTPASSTSTPASSGSLPAAEPSEGSASPSPTAEETPFDDIEPDAVNVDNLDKPLLPQPTPSASP